MPELPEVETIIKDLNDKILKKKITRVDARLKRIIKSPIKKFISELKGNKFINIQRRGKLLIFKLARNDQYLLIHLRMTGQLIYRQGKKITAGGHDYPNKFNDLPNKYSHLVFCFSDNSCLFFNDQRQFGVIKIVSENKLKNIFSGFGLEPLERGFTLPVFKTILDGKKGNIKAFLLNQKFIAGLGNIYADEVLFAAGVLPSRKVDSLSTEEVKKIYKSIKSILKKAIKYRGTTFNNYLDAEGKRGSFSKLLKVYRREGEKCLKCKRDIIQKTKIAGRGTRFCPRCQR